MFRLWGKNIHNLNWVLIGEFNLANAEYYMDTHEDEYVSFFLEE